MSGSGGSGDKPPSVDQDGKMINPHNPEFITKVPWYLGDSGPTLKHHSIQNKSHELSITETDQLIAKKLAAQSEILQASKRTTYRKGACKNCGAMTHQEKDCLERPRSSKKMAWKSGLDIAADEVVLDLAQHGKLSYSAKRDQWKGFDPSEYQEIVERHNRLEDERRKLVEAEQQAKQRALEAEAEAQRHSRAARKAAKAERAARRQASVASGAAVSDSDESDDYSDASDSDGDDANRRRALDAAHPDDGVKASDANTRDFQGTLIPQGGVGGNGMRITSRNLRIREDTPKYLRNLSLDSAFYDPKSRSMRANPYGNVANPDDLAFAGDNFVRYSGDAVELAKNQVLCWEMVEKGAMPEALAELGGAGMIDVIANPSQAEYLKRQFELKKAEVQAAKKRALYAKYLGTDDDAPSADSAAASVASAASAGSSSGGSGSGNGSAQAPKALDIRLRLGQTEAYVEYDRDGRVVKGPGATSKGGVPLVSPMTKYEEDAFPLNHTSVWGSYYSRARACWGYACCHSTLKNAYCIGAAGREANDAAMRQESQLAVRKQAKEDERQGGGGAGRRGAVPLFDANATATTEPPAISDGDKSKWAALTQRFDGGTGTGGGGKGSSSSGAKGGNEDDADGGKKRPLLGFGSGAAVDVSEADLEEFRRKRVKHEDPMAAFLDQPDVLLDR